MAVKMQKRKTTSIKATPKRAAPKRPAAKKPAARKPAPKVAVKPAKAKSKARAAAKPRAAVATAAPPAKKAWLFPPVVHWEIQAADAGNQRAFYSDLFGWSIDANNPQNYGMVAAAGDGAIGGGISAAQDGDGKSSVTFYVEVPDINAF